MDLMSTLEIANVKENKRSAMSWLKPSLLILGGLVITTGCKGLQIVLERQWPSHERLVYLAVMAIYAILIVY